VIAHIWKRWTTPLILEEVDNSPYSRRGGQLPTEKGWFIASPHIHTQTFLPTTLWKAW